MNSGQAQENDTNNNSQRFKYTLKNAGLFYPNFGSNVDKPSYWVTFLNDIFTINDIFVHI